MSDFRTGMSGECMSIVYRKTGILPKHIFVKPGNDESFVKYVPERTCKLRFHNSYFAPCDCGYGVHFGMNFCPNCGSKVVE